MKRTALILILAAAAGAAFWYADRRRPGGVQVDTAPLTRGPIVETVGATGTLQAVTTVQIGSQVSGNIRFLGADFNAIVRKGQVVAKLDPSLFQAQVDQARANLTRAQADLERNRVALDDAQQKLERARELDARSLLARSDLDAAQVALDAAVATVKSSQASVAQAQASLSQAEVNLQHTVITSPIDGIVTQRNVDVGQTVAASLQSPTLFVVAADLTKMQVNASIDEADVGRIRPQQPVSFRVDAYPAEEFHGTVTQVRLQPVVVQNVTTYGAVIDVPNPQLELKPGMTATVRIEVARRDDALRVPNTALRFRPSDDMFAALNQPPPAAPVAPRARIGAAARIPTSEESAGTAGRRSASGDWRERRSARLLEASAPAVDATSPAMASGAATIDALFAPVPSVETEGRAWIYTGGLLEPVPLRLGLSDGVNTEVLGPEADAEPFAPGTEVVTGIALGAAPAVAASSASGGAGNPLLPQRGRPTGRGGR
ncbi:MAG: efflux RND transporter periplasmic adaptor subunit [Acidobacteria bacterium]|nr:efflux RND transporter periplasmic adaptor subunit [Acidobacteriota bacterium]